MAGLYSIFDKKAGTYHNPFVAQTDGAAVRNIKAAMESGGESLLARYPEDFDVYRLGAFSEVDGAITAERATFVVNAGALRVQETAKIREVSKE